MLKLVLCHNFSETVWRQLALWLAISATIQLVINDDASTHDGATFDNGPDGLGNSFFQVDPLN